MQLRKRRHQDNTVSHTCIVAHSQISEVSCHIPANRIYRHEAGLWLQDQPNMVASFEGLGATSKRQNLRPGGF